MRGWPAARTRSARKRWFDTSSVSSPNSVGRNWRRGASRPSQRSIRPFRARGRHGRTHLVAEAGVATADALLVAGPHGEAHDAVEAGGTGLAGGRAGGVGVVLEVGGRGAADVGVAAVGVFPDRVGAVEGEEGERRARGLLGALHLQDCAGYDSATFVCTRRE